jgi:hypothetical protein
MGVQQGLSGRGVACSSPCARQIEAGPGGFCRNCRGDALGWVLAVQPSCGALMRLGLLAGWLDVGRNAVGSGRSGRGGLCGGRELPCLLRGLVMVRRAIAASLGVGCHRMCWW